MNIQGRRARVMIGLFILAAGVLAPALAMSAEGPPKEAAPPELR
jgi:hypothetical protein